ncbi:MAG: hypothetical protein A2152_01985 [Candidatus Levybacteria bacterium RBG_16_35_6]|nr:MAG: hypothetical protein A2152_01985 [Candidatus Levybacteria bacterium RBG_16_35_6]
MVVTDNYKKYTSKNPLKKLFINNFFNAICNELCGLGINSILDVGCGEGFTLKRLKQKAIGNKFTGVDSSKEAITLGKKENPNLDLRVGDIYNLKFKDNSFDLVLCMEVLEHLKEPEKALAELKRTSKKYLLLSVPNEPWFYLFNYTQWGKDIGHINKWSARNFKKFAGASGLKILSVKTSFPWTIIICEV